MRQNRKTRRGAAGVVLFLPLILFSAPLFAQDGFKGQMLEQAGQLEQAWTVYKTTLEKNPEDRQALLGVVRVSRQLGRFDSLLSILQKVEGVVPDNAEVTLGIIEALLGLKRKSAARERAQRFFEKWPGRVMELVEAILRGGEKGWAAQYLEERLRRDGFRVEYTEKLLEIYEMQGRFVTAAEKLVDIVNYEPRRFNKFVDRLGSYGRSGEVKRVLNVLSKIKDETIRLRAQAEVALGAGDELGAVRIIQNSLNRGEMVNFARGCEKRGALRAALAIYQEQKLGADAARVLRKMGRIDEALALLSQDTSVAARFEYAEYARLEKRDFKSAVQGYRAVLKKKPDYRAALLGLAAALVGLRQLDSAQQVLRKITAPDDSVLFLQAKILFYQGKFDSVRAIVREINARFPQSLLANDALELGMLTLSGERGLELARAMLDLDAGAVEISLKQAQGLMRGNDAVAQDAFFLVSQIYRQEGNYRAALTVLDSLLVRFPKGERAARALLEQAEIYRQGLKDESRFRATIERLIMEFPGSPYASLGRNLLRKATTDFAPGAVR
ncbi:MAG: tetratricopeptide repeat protein [candidate division WOR-3 bacterium]|jgi:tetratricopeptide (TPR) repeat protein|nr:tetratricopeptide repeat protein [candidate division WOR-3 bacterium]MDH7518898.1 tetratricopeptide repeat protein [bacterium]